VIEVCNNQRRDLVIEPRGKPGMYLLKPK
jgi:hypothetical protein